MFPTAGNRRRASVQHCPSTTSLVESTNAATAAQSSSTASGEDLSAIDKTIAPEASIIELPLTANNAIRDAAITRLSDRGRSAQDWLPIAISTIIVAACACPSERHNR